MIIDYFHVICVSLRPSKAYSPFIVYSYTVPTFKASFKFFETITGGYSQIVDVHCRIQDIQLPQGYFGKIKRHFLGSLAPKELTGFF